MSLSSSLSWQHTGLSLLRIITGLLLIYHGWEIFSAAKMKEYAQWEALGRFLPASAMAYAGKAAELLAGVLLAIGLFTRAAALLGAGTLLYICFFIGQGRFWYEDQHPFVFALLCLVFFFTGSSSWSIDGLRQRKNK
ncbi:MAG TPA: DoxX family protein [Chitinophagaceae bacterium]|nr:DoxX family protein [Chitinophagaceae bacterium]